MQVSEGKDDSVSSYGNLSMEERQERDVDMKIESDADLKAESKEVNFVSAVLPAIFSGGCDYYGLGMISPLLPYYIESTLNADRAWVGYITTAQYIGVLLGSITWGRIADRFGIKRAIQIALLGDVVFFLLTGFCEDVITLALCRLLAGFFTPLVASISWVITSSRGDPGITAKNMGAWAFAMTVGFMIGSVVGGLLGTENWIAAHASASGLALVGFVAITMSTEPKKAGQVEGASNEPEGMDVILKAPEYLALLCTNFYVGLIFTGGVIAASLILAYRMGASPIEVAMYFCFSALLHSGMNFYIIPWGVKKFGSPFPAMKATLFFVMLCNFFMFFDFAYSSVYVFILISAVTTMALPMFMTSANMVSGQYAAKYTKNSQSLVLGFSRLCFNVGQILGPIVAVILVEVGQGVYFFGIGCFGAVCFLFWNHYHHTSFLVKGSPESQVCDPIAYIMCCSGSTTDIEKTNNENNLEMVKNDNETIKC